MNDEQLKLLRYLVLELHRFSFEPDSMDDAVLYGDSLYHYWNDLSKLQRSQYNNDLISYHNGENKEVTSEFVFNQIVDILNELEESKS
jgi:hypothetical protein